MPVTETISLTQEDWSIVRRALAINAANTRDPQRHVAMQRIYEAIVNQGAAQAADLAITAMRNTNADRMTSTPARMVCSNAPTVEPTLVCGHTSNAPNCPACAAWRNAEKPAPVNGYDYQNQAWVRNGRYYDCSHPEANCGCYGRAHAGEPVAANANVH